MSDVEQPQKPKSWGDEVNGRVTEFCRFTVENLQASIGDMVKRAKLVQHEEDVVRAHLNGLVDVLVRATFTACGDTAEVEAVLLQQVTKRCGVIRNRRIADDIMAPPAAVIPILGGARD